MRSLYMITFVTCILFPAISVAQSQVSTAWVEQNLKQDGPRLLWQAGDADLIRAIVAQDETAAIFHAYLIGQADGILEAQPLERKVTGRRLLGVSRQALKRATHLAYAWRITGESRYLDGMDQLLQSVCNFSDWNPSHFLDVAEMSLAVAIALDWTGEALPAKTVQLARAALLEKGLRESEKERSAYAFNMRNNWDQVCNAGMVAAALVLREEDPELTTRTLNRMLETLPNILGTYAPDGVYVEGASYWEYGTMFNVVMLSMLQTALGTTFALEDWPGFMESADFVHQMTAPSGMFFNFSDCGLHASLMEAMFWFAKETGQRRHLQEEAVRALPDQRVDPEGQGLRMAPLAFLWHVHFKPGQEIPLEQEWVGLGDNPVGVFRSSFDDPEALYLAFKGGRATLSHPNMDAGSFILEADGIRWALDLDKGDYHRIEEYFKEHGGSLWSREQDSERWTLLNKNNFGHSTLTIDEELHLVDGQATITAFDADRQTAVVDMTGPLANKAESVLRTFSVIGEKSVEINDELVLNNGDSRVRWQMMTRADVHTMRGGAVLWYEGKALKLSVIEPEDVQVSVTSLFPPPLIIDEFLGALKRIDINVPTYRIQDGNLRIRVQLSAVDPADVRSEFMAEHYHPDNPFDWGDVTRPPAIRRMMEKAFDWQIDNGTPSHRGLGWITGTFHTGIAAAYEATGTRKYRQAIIELGKEADWQLRARPGSIGSMLHADNHCLGQAWLDLYTMDSDPQDEWIEGVRERMDFVMENAPRGREDYWWCDALFMAPPVFARLARITGEEKYLDYIDQQWWDTTEFLYNPEHRLFFRDESYFSEREPNGKPVFWSRGNGWVIGGLVRMLQYLPEDWPTRPAYLKLYRDMMQAVVESQVASHNLWSSSLLYPEKFDEQPEASGSAFFIYGLAWGINEGILDRETYAPVLERAWPSIAAMVNPRGTIEFIQQVGASPEAVSGEYFNKDYGYGAFLLAGSEMLRYYDRRQNHRGHP